MATAHLLHGYLGVGKTTLARRLAAEHDAIRFTHDEWMARLYGVDPPSETFEDRALAVTELMEAIWTRCLQLDVNIVLDAGLWRRAERDRVRALVTAQGADAKLYAVTCPEPIAWARIQQRNREPKGALLITLATYDILKGKFEPLGDDEARVTVDTSKLFSPPADA